MLTLAAIAYRGFELVELGPAKDAAMYRAMTKCLEELDPVKDQWDIVWGPASFSPFLIGFADTAVYIVQHRQKPYIYVISVRGTNPICLFDWVFLDFMAAKQVPWAYGNPVELPGAQVSFSTALSLNILQHLRSPSQKKGFLEGARSLLTKLLSAESSGALLDSRNDFRRLLDFVPRGDSSLQRTWLEILRVRDRFPIPCGRENAWEESAKRLQAQERDSSSLLMTLVREEESLSSGVDLRTFLAGRIANSEDKIQLFVTGHSKGGALSSTLALWLADTQGNENASEEDRWDPTRKATLYAYSFAGPTAGNAQFAKHSDNIIGPRCYRIVNARDIVPCAWDPRELRSVPALFSNPEVRDHLNDLIEPSMRLFGQLDYQQIGKNVKTYPGIRNSDSFFVEIIHQHLDGYFEQMGLAGKMTARTFFTPLLLAP